MITCRVATLFVVAVLSSPSARSIAAELRTVALSGQPGPGSASGATFEYFNDPALNNAGKTAFIARLGDPNQQVDGRAVLSEGTGTLELIASEKTQAPGAPVGVEFVNFSTPVLNDNGNVAYAGIARIGLSKSVTGLYTHQLGNTVPVIVDGNQAPGTPNGVTFDGLVNGVVRLNAIGNVASKFFIEGNGVDSSNDIGIWSTHEESLELVARDGDHATDTPDGILFNISFGEPLLNDTGVIAFRGSLVGATVDSTNDGGIWAGIPGNLQLVAREGNQAPGTLSGVSFAHFRDVTLNLSGDTAFRAGVSGNGVDSTNELGIWRGSPDNLELLARGGSSAPGTADDAVFRRFSYPLLNDLGHVAFQATLTGDHVDVLNDDGIWSGTAGDIALVARGGDQAPGTPIGAEFDEFDSIVLNSNNQIAFVAQLFTPRQWVSGGPLIGNPEGGVNDENDEGIWATDSRGVLHLIAREGDVLKVGPNDFRTISDIHFAGNTGNGDGKRSGFNDRGQLAFAAHFTDGSSGVFVSNLVAVPEPSSMTLALAVGAAICVFGHRSTKFLAR